MVSVRVERFENPDRIVLTDDFRGVLLFILFLFVGSIGLIHLEMEAVEIDCFPTDEGTACQARSTDPAASYFEFAPASVTIVRRNDDSQLALQLTQEGQHFLIRADSPLSSTKKTKDLLDQLQADLLALRDDPARESLVFRESFWRGASLPSSRSPRSSLLPSFSSLPAVARISSWTKSGLPIKGASS